MDSNNKCKSLTTLIKRLLKLMKAEDDDDSKDDIPNMIKKQIVMDKDQKKAGTPEKEDIIDDYVSPPYKFPSEEYKIAGDTSEIEKIINTCGFMDIDVPDLTRTLSKESINYVTVGYAEGPRFIANAFKDAWDKLPVENGGITNLLINIWAPKIIPSPKNIKSLMKEIDLMVDCFGLLPDDIEGIFYGCAWDESLNGQQAKVSLIASSR